MQKFIFLILLLMIISCKTDKKKADNKFPVDEMKYYEKFLIDKKINNNDTIKLLAKFPELKLYKTDINKSKTRSAYIVQTVGAYNFYVTFKDYKSSAYVKNDTLNISLNNSNGYFGNGVLVKVFDGQYFIKDIDPKTLRGEEKFLPSKAIFQKLTLSDDQFRKDDSIYGAIYYSATVDNRIYKESRGFFRTKIK